MQHLHQSLHGPPEGLPGKHPEIGIQLSFPALAEAVQLAVKPVQVRPVDLVEVENLTGAVGQAEVAARVEAVDQVERIVHAEEDEDEQAPEECQGHEGDLGKLSGPEHEVYCLGEELVE